MNILGIGAPELVVIFLIALMVAGPKRMIAWAYTLGQWMAKLRRMWGEVVDLVQKEINDAGVDVRLPREMPTRQNLSRLTGNALKPFTDPLNESLREVDQVNQDTRKALQGAKTEAQTSRPAVKTPAAATTTPPKPKTETQFGTWSGSQNGVTAAPQDTSTEFGTWTGKDTEQA